MSHWTSKALGKTTYPIKAGTNHSAEISHHLVEPLACIIQPSSHKGTKRWATKPPRHRATKPLSHRATELQATKQDSNMPRDLSDFLLVLGLLVGSPVCSFALGGRVCSTAPGGNQVDGLPPAPSVLLLSNTPAVIRKAEDLFPVRRVIRKLSS